MLLVGGVTACGSTTEPEHGDSELALAVAVAAGAMMPATVEGGHPYVQPCPSGGRFVVEGSTSFRFDPDDGTSVDGWDVVMRNEACGMRVHGTDVVTDGVMHLFGEARYDPPVDGRTPLRFQDSHQIGWLAVDHGGQRVTCEFDLSIAFDAAVDDSYRISGSACGRPIDARAPTTPP